MQGTIAAAAAQLGYTPSAVSQQLSAAERSSGVPLLERVGRNVMLTDAGRELVVHAEMVLAHLEQAQAAIERVHGEVAGTIQLGFIESVGSSLLGPLLTRLRLDHPALSVRTKWADTDDPSELVRSGSLDLAFAVGYAEGQGARPPTVEHVEICADPFRIAVARPWFEGEPPTVMDLAKLADEPFIAPPFSDNCGRAVILACRRAGFEPNVAHEVPDYPTTLRLIAAGVGVSLVPDLGLRQVPDDVVVMDPVVPVHRTIDVVFRSSSAERPAMRAVIAAIQTVAVELSLRSAP